MPSEEDATAASGNYMCMLDGEGNIECNAANRCCRQRYGILYTPEMPIRAKQRQCAAMYLVCLPLQKMR